MKLWIDAQLSPKLADWLNRNYAVKATHIGALGLLRAKDMAMHATVTSKGQVTIPKPIRDRLHLKPGDKIDFILDEAGDLRVTLVTVPVARLKGMVPKPGSPVSLEKMDEAIVRGATRKR